ncbi:hypothetical protein Pth03_32160 [Planotetraspora thailandica]|uniref:Uncharacterized protein n=1 Tax=Planotetraspora thailandica TaxID=487172 RepID=A0A8J3V042_9ACTN|nr:hypothetical protein Pth03_32160 [Planotetraspora thailandica]
MEPDLGDHPGDAGRAPLTVRPAPEITPISGAGLKVVDLQTENNGTATDGAHSLLNVIEGGTDP